MTILTKFGFTQTITDVLQSAQVCMTHQIPTLQSIMAPRNQHLTAATEPATQTNPVRHALLTAEPARLTAATEPATQVKPVHHARLTAEIVPRHKNARK